MEEVKVEQYKDMKVFYKDSLNGGGNLFGQQFIPVVKEKFGSLGRVLEFCGGPGFIGFSLLAEGLCKEVVFVEINPDAVEMLNKTIIENGLTQVARVYLSDGLANLPSEEKFDLVVSNPPHFKKHPGLGLLAYDEEWDIHKEFYQDVGKHLTDNGSILFQENYLGSDETDFVGMVKQNGLMYAGSFMFEEKVDSMVATFYFFHAKKPLHAKLTHDDTPEQLHLRNREIYELSLESDGELEGELTLSNLNKTFFNIIPFVRLKKGKTQYKTCKFYLTNGQFELVDKNSKKCYLKISVN